MSLRPMGERDLGWCHALADRCAPGWLRVCGGGVPLPPQFHERIWRGVHAQFVVQDASIGPFAVTALFDVYEGHGTGWLDVASGLDDAEAERLILTEMITHAFGRCGLRKVYLRYPGWKVPAIDPVWEPAREALLEDHLLHEGTYWDVGVLTVTRPAAT